MKAKIKATDEETEVSLHSINDSGEVKFQDTRGRLFNVFELTILPTYGKKCFYKSEKWLNPPTSPSTGSIVCFDGMVDYSEGPDRCTFLELADCHQKIRLHKTHTDSVEEFVEKLKLVRAEVDNFIQHLESNV